MKILMEIVKSVTVFLLVNLLIKFLVSEYQSKMGNSRMQKSEMQHPRTGCILERCHICHRDCHLNPTRHKVLFVSSIDHLMVLEVSSISSLGVGPGLKPFSEQDCLLIPIDNYEGQLKIQIMLIGQRKMTVCRNQWQLPDIMVLNQAGGDFQSFIIHYLKCIIKK